MLCAPETRGRTEVMWNAGESAGVCSAQPVHPEHTVCLFLQHHSSGTNRNCQTHICLAVLHARAHTWRDVSAQGPGSFVLSKRRSAFRD